jgi:hypothetical protein
MKSLLLFCVCVASAFAQSNPPAQSQDQPTAQRGERAQRGGTGMGSGSGMGGGMRMRGTGGQITAINGSSYVVKTMDGKTLTIETTADTKFTREREEISPKELKVGDFIMARSGSDAPPTDGKVKAAAVFVVPAERAQMMKQMAENFGKTFIAGEVKSIDETKLTISRPDGQTQVIEVDENTSFKRGQESITLADIKVGDRVMGQGEIKNGTFVPKTLRVGGMQVQR